LESGHAHDPVLPLTFSACGDFGIAAHSNP
jgi:hypothetical protein